MVDWTNKRVPIVAVTINNHGPYQFLIDTGSQVSSIDLDLARHLKLKADTTRRIIITDGAKGVLTSNVMLQQFRIGAIPFDGIRLPAIPEKGSECTATDGTIGTDILRHFSVSFDFDRNGIRFALPGTNTIGSTAATRLVMSEGGEDPVIETTIDRHRARLMIDTGADSGIALAHGYVSRTKLDLHAVSILRRSSVYGSFSESIMMDTARLSSIVIARDAIKLPRVEMFRSHRQDTSGYDGVIGCELLSKFVVTFDFPNKIMWLTPGRTFKKPMVFNRTGMVLIGDTVVKVVSGGPAWRAGVLAGDVLVAYNGVKLTNTTRTWEYSIVRQPVGTVLWITLLRRQKSLRVPLRLKDVL